MSTRQLYAGLMSGTSLDGIDAILADFGNTPWQLREHVYRSYPDDLRSRLLLLHRPQANELHETMLAANELTRCYAAAIAELLTQAGVKAQEITAIGCHGQTVRHAPQLGYSLQLCNGALLAELTEITVVCDFRSRDIAAAGQGAPLVPAFHAALSLGSNAHRVIVNIGGMANLTNLPPESPASGFDCGPGNMLLDAWCQKHTGQRYDADGDWAMSGQIIPELLQRLLIHPFFVESPPKSGGREQFNLQWLNGFLSGKEAPQDVQATLLALTVQGIAQAIQKYCRGAQEIYFCGGGARNKALVKNLRDALPRVRTDVTDALGINAQTLEAYAFAWLAWQTLQGKPGNMPQATGAKGPRVLGAIYKK
ncbi:MAG TPA: anhydro-N-acetylmuramic acid kinase [Burkholderiales bacterium]|nr:anhydro-N-acetylmuramic acid kinase [Burkholderiales bacterium]